MTTRARLPDDFPDCPVCGCRDTRRSVEFSREGDVELIWFQCGDDGCRYQWHHAATSPDDQSEFDQPDDGPCDEEY
jgi:hypothetical protein